MDLPAFIQQWAPANSQQASVCGGLVGVLIALIFVLARALLSPRTGAAQPEPPTVQPRQSRHDRSLKLLVELAACKPAAAAPVSKPAAPSAAAGPAGSVCDEEEDDNEEEEEWDTETGDSDDQGNVPSSQVSEYERMEEQRLKMVFVVRQFTPKLPANTVAELTAGAGVGLVEWINSLQAAAPGDVAPQHAQPLLTAHDMASHGCIADSEAEELTNWRTWYAWWNRIGCGKITLRCSEPDAMEAVAASAVLNRIPVFLMKKSHITMASPESDHGKKSKGGAPAVFGGGAPSPDAQEIVVAALGPAPASVLDPITGSFKLFN